ncbi:conjugative relaxase-like TrwC/TraI family protein [Microbacterium terrae]|uniref:Multifunctional conjugation protein TraI n=2 Tax=Microbacterium terrae TaxID=69369 RepID=A0A0M2H1Z2_9MICO|nr:MobF family relaxase [Microbacterium terrae]KJL37583.1 Multifunctional conjugation protein TraI [Microbacterium terrae]MBP1076415.1 conjugative relaxase-like TrwC/TraI family protein [Microbacterium terrae]GLJ97242.1 TraA/ATP-dependent exoDNAse/relaxase [Microbacterium terrae]
MTVSMRVMSAGDGYKYLLRTVAAGDGDRSLSTPLTRYYSAEGTPPGRWMGGGLASLGRSIHTGAEVSERQLQLLIGMGRHPISGEPLGRAYPQYAPTDDAASRRRAVAGYDFTFSIPKSASVLWGVAGASIQERIVGAHHAAVAQTVAYLEREVAATRIGATARDGAVAQVGVAGIIATAFDHFDSRAGDPHLHTHVVISNKVQTLLDGKWRSLDGRPLHAAVVALSELHEALFADELTRRLGVAWEPRQRGRDRNIAWAISGVPENLVREFSSRARDIDVATDALIAEFLERHGRRPEPATIMKLRAQATLSTRPEKTVRSLAELTAAWRDRAGQILDRDAASWARSVAQGAPPTVVRAEDVPLEVVESLGRSVVDAVAEKRTTWRRWNLLAEAARQTMKYRFAAASDREVITEMVADAAERASLRLTAPELASSPVEFQRADGSSVFRPRAGALFTAHTLMDAEARLLARSRNLLAPRVDPHILRRRTAVVTLSNAQVTALAAVLGSGRALDVLVGPAGAGKTTAMLALRKAWEATHGAGSVVGLAPSAAAAHVLAADIGIATENTAKWWQNHLMRGETLRAGQLVIIDEASLAGTLSLDRITELATDAGAKVLLVGDHAQLQAVDAGGAFALLVHDRDDVAHLSDVHRFRHDWEKRASIQLRDGDVDVVETYAENDRIREGTVEAMIDEAYSAWRKDMGAGKSSILVSDSNDAIATLNARARADRILAGEVTGAHEVELRDGSRAARGDIVITRLNDRRLRTGRSWVRNGDRWVVDEVLAGGELRVRRADAKRSWSVALPADYVAENLDLGYAITAHRAQGITTDTAHTLVQSGMTRENLYVSMTRGREANTAYVSTDRPDLEHVEPHPGDDARATARTVLRGVMQHVGAALSAHERMGAEQDNWGSIAQLAAEYETIAAAAQRPRWVALIEASGLTREQAAAAIESDAFGHLSAELRRAEAGGANVDALLPAVVRSRGFDDAQDTAAVLAARVARASEGRRQSLGRRVPRHIVGLLAEALGPMPDEMRHSLDERRGLMDARAMALVDRARERGDQWLHELGAAPVASTQAVWRRAATVVAAYRDRYDVRSRDAIGPEPETDAQRRDAAAARAAIDAARRAERAAQQAPVGRPTHRRGATLSR